MEFTTVREVPHEEKSVQEIEASLLAKHEEEHQQAAAPQEPAAEVAQSAPEFDEKIVLTHIKDRYNKEFSSVDEMLSQRQANEDLPEDVSAFFKFKKDTGRGIDDFVKVNRDFEKEDPKKLLSEYMAMNNPDLDPDDIMFEIDQKYSYDDEFDDEREIKQKKIAMKKDLSDALKFFNQQKEQYKMPLGSSDASVPGNERESYEQYKRTMQEAASSQENSKKQSDYFVQKTNDLFSDKFKGFEFNINGKELAYKPGDTEKIKQSQMDVNNFIKNHVNEQGFLKDAAAYHKSLSVAMNPDAFAKHFYEQGQADAISDSTREMKNIDMGGVRRSPEVTSKEGFKVTAIDDERGNSLRIKSNKIR
jgi:hypothetical protein